MEVGGQRHPLRFTPGNDPVPIVQEAGWVPGQVWTGAENLAPTGIRSPDRPARSESCYTDWAIPAREREREREKEKDKLSKGCLRAYLERIRGRAVTASAS